MRVISIRSEAARPSHHELARTLLGPDAVGLPLPPLADIVGALCALAEGQRRKALLPLGAMPAELVLARRGAHVLVSYLITDGALEPRALDRPIALAPLLARCAALADASAASQADPIARGLLVRLVERARAVSVIGDEPEDPPAIVRRGGAVQSPGSKVPLAFGFEASITALSDPPRQTLAHSDVHALLFPGSLWMWARGRRIPVLRGPLMLAVQRMVAAVRGLLDAVHEGRGANLRLRAGRFTVGVRLERGAPDNVSEREAGLRGRRREVREEPPIRARATRANTATSPLVQLTLGTEDEGIVTVPELALADVALPILRLASDLVRALLAVDRTQARNLRVSGLRDEVRALRKKIRAAAPRAESVVCDDPERLRASSPALDAVQLDPVAVAPRALRFGARWDAEVEGLDAASTFLCGDRLIVASPRHTVALDRDDGRVLWARREEASATFMAGAVLARLSADGRLALCDVRDGEPYAEASLAPRTQGAAAGLLVGGGSVPPLVIVAEGLNRLVAVDVRTGELRWRHVEPGPGSFTLSRAGRLVLCASGSEAISAIDAITGELVWRCVGDGPRFGFAPAVSGEVVLAASSDARSCGELLGIDLFSGRIRWRHELGAPPVSGVTTGARVAAIALGGTRRASLAAFDSETGSPRWTASDPGTAIGGSSLVVDRSLVINGPAGRVVALDLSDGSVQWKRRLAHPVADDVPRRLEPVLRGGALFVPSAKVHVLRTSDGTSIGDPLECELVPDWMRVDERGWVYVAEESGHLCALAPRPQLSLVR